MSTHAVRIVRVPEPIPHDNAERLEIFLIDGWQVVTRKGLHRPGELAVFIPFDYVVPSGVLDDDQAEPVRIRQQKLRGVLSQGVLLKLPGCQEHRLYGFLGCIRAEEGLDVKEALGITRYEPAVATGGPVNSGPTPQGVGHVPVFDVENFENYGTFLFKPGEQVIATEKIHGGNARFVWAKDTEGQERLFVGTRKRWLKPDEQNDWSYAARRYPQIERWCRDHAGMILFGEVFGPTQSLKYGSPHEPMFVGFAVYNQANPIPWTGAEVLRNDLKAYGIPQPQAVYMGPFDPSALRACALGDSCVPGAGHEREGIVIQPWPTLRMTREIGPLWLKIINPEYSQKG